MLARRWKMNYSLTKNWLSSFFLLIYCPLVSSHHFNGWCFNHTKLCAIDPIIFLSFFLSFFCLNGNILDLLAPNHQIQLSRVTNCLLSTWLLLAVLNLRQIADRISKEKYEMIMHFCVCCRQIHIWIAVQKYSHIRIVCNM